MMQSEHRSDPGLATSLRISVSRLARRLRVERAAAGLVMGLFALWYVPRMKRARARSAARRRARDPQA